MSGKVKWRTSVNKIAGIMTDRCCRDRSRHVQGWQLDRSQGIIMLQLEVSVRKNAGNMTDGVAEIASVMYMVGSWVVRK
jgi:hypothetical protein